MLNFLVCPEFSPEPKSIRLSVSGELVLIPILPDDVIVNLSAEPVTSLILKEELVIYKIPIASFFASVISLAVLTTSKVNAWVTCASSPTAIAISLELQWVVFFAIISSIAIRHLALIAFSIQSCWPYAA